MPIITTTAELADLCRRLRQGDHITIDTEFIRDRTYWPRLCLVQVAGDDEARVIDPLADGMDLAPLLELLDDPDVIKVFHAARQDVEIFYRLTGKVPAPLFDTQIAAMVCGFGDSVGYDKLVGELAGVRIDKASQFTDWARRPLSERQLRYALDDVVHLQVIYAKLVAQLEKSGRSGWLDEEMAILADPETYAVEPENAWRRLKTRSRNPEYLGVMKELATWRESEAQRRDLPRNRLLRDEAIYEIAAERPQRIEDLKRLRAVPKGVAEGPLGEPLLAAVKRGRNLPADQLPQTEAPQQLPRGIGPLVDLLKVLLKMACEKHGVAQKLIANVADLERIAAFDDADVAALKGWRREIFGADALDLKRGRIALSAAGKRIKVIRVEPPRRGAEAAD